MHSHFGTFVTDWGIRIWPVISFGHAVSQTCQNLHNAAIFPKDLEPSGRISLFFFSFQDAFHILLAVNSEGSMSELPKPSPLEP